MNIRILPVSQGESTLPAPPVRRPPNASYAVLVAGLSGAGVHIDLAAVQAVQTSSTMNTEPNSEGGRRVRLATQLARVAGLAAGWDGEDAPAPTQRAVALANDALDALLRGKLPPDEVDGDADGGVALTLSSHASSRRAWVVCPNVGPAHVVLHGDPETPVRALELNDGWVREVAGYLGHA